ncbi:MAG: DUF4012 domain-containing protein [Chloroflexi bacterium]|nr:DUF4012 domain-containing protein [Chloroflexota bacterium]
MQTLWLTARKHWKRWIVLLSLLLVLGTGGLFWSRINHHVSVIDQQLQAVEGAVADPSILARDDLADLRKRLERAKGALAALRVETTPVLWLSPVLGYLPGIGGDIQQARAILSYGLHLARAGDLVLGAMEPVVPSNLEGQTLEELLPLVARKLEEGQDLFQQASLETARAREARSSVLEKRLSSRALGRLERGDALARHLDTLTVLGLRGPSAIHSLGEALKAAERLKDALAASSGGYAGPTSGELLEVATLLEQAGAVLREEDLSGGIELVLPALPRSVTGGVSLEALRNMVGMAEELSLAVAPLLELKEGVASLPGEEHLEDRLTMAAELMAVQRPRFQESRQALDGVRQYQVALEGLRVPPQMEELLGLADSYLPELEALLDVAEAGGTLYIGWERLLAEAASGMFTERFGEVVGEVLREWEERSAYALGVLASSGKNHGNPGLEGAGPRELLGTELERLQGIFSQVLSSARLLNDLLGFEGERAYLVLGQDDHELRPTGGFIGSVAEIRLNRGAMEVVQFRSSYDIDPASYEGFTVGPPAFWKYMAGVPGLLTFRDSNWWPDFPATAKTAIQYYQRTQPLELAGVIAIDTRVLAAIIDSLDGVRVPGAFRPIDGERARELFAGFVYYPCRPEHSSNVGNRCFSEDLMNVLLERLRHPADGVQMVGLLLEVLREKHVLLYSPYAEAQGALEDLGWGGRLKEHQGDYLAAFDWTAYSKASDSVERSLSYDVSLSISGEAEARLVVRYKNSAESSGPCFQTFDDPRACYWNYLRVYVPADIELSETPTFPLPHGTLYQWLAEQRGEVIGEEDTFEVAYKDHYTEMAAFMVVDGGQTQELAFRYRLPAGVVEETGGGTWLYHLTVQKQPGTLAEVATVRINLPPGSAVVDGGPGEFSTSGTSVSFDLSLSTDREVFLEFRLP